MKQQNAPQVMSIYQMRVEATKTCKSLDAVQKQIESLHQQQRMLTDLLCAQVVAMGALAKAGVRGDQA